MKTDRELQLEEENRRLKAKLNWIHNLMTNETIQPREKVVLYQTEYEISHSKQDESGLSHVRVWKIADETGIGRKVVGKSLQLLADNGVLTRKTTHILDRDTGTPEKSIFLGLTDAAKNPKKIELPTNNHGGKRTKKFCTACGHTEYIEHKRCVCTACGTQFEETWKTVDDTTKEDNE